MAKAIIVWFDPEADYLEVMFEKKAGYFRETDHEALMEKVDHQGHLIGFSLLGVSQLRDQPLLTSIAVLINLVYFQERAGFKQPLTITEMLANLSQTPKVNQVI